MHAERRFRSLWCLALLVVTVTASGFAVRGDAAWVWRSGGLEAKELPVRPLLAPPQDQLILLRNPAGGVVVVPRRQPKAKSTFAQPSAWMISSPDAIPTQIRLPDGTGDIVAAAYSRDRLCLLSPPDIIVVGPGDEVALRTAAGSVEMFFNRYPQVGLPIGEHPWHFGDDNGWLWFGDSFVGVCASVVPANERSPYFPEGRLPFRARWFETWSMAVDSSGRGAYVYGQTSLGTLRSTLVKWTASESPDTVLPTLGFEELSEDIPALASPCMTVDANGNIWLAGYDASGVVVMRITDEAIADVSPEAAVIGGARITDLAVFDGWVYAVTDARGVIRFSGGRWEQDPVNTLLPKVRHSDIRPVNAVAVNTAGNLWVTSGPNLICRESIQLDAG